MQLQVVVQSDSGVERTEIHPASGPITVGRHPQCTLRLESDLVSRQHVVLSAARGQLHVEDVSTNGTIAGDLLLRRDAVDVPYGTPIVVGDYTVFVYPLEAAAAAPAPASLPPPRPAPLPRPQADGWAGAGVETRIPQAQNGLLPPIAGRKSPVLSPPVARTAQIPRAAGPTGGEALRADASLRQKIHALLLDSLGLSAIDATKRSDPSLAPRVVEALRSILAGFDRLPADVDPNQLIDELADEALGLGPLERLLADPSITEIMVVDPETIYVEQSGRVVPTKTRFTDDARARAIVERMVRPLGYRVDESSTSVEARLEDGSRLHAVFRPLARRGCSITIRKFSNVPLGYDKLVSSGVLTERMGRFLIRSVQAKKNVLVAGGRGTGKTTLLNALSEFIPDDERIVTVEDGAELKLKQPHVVSLETRPAEAARTGSSLRDLVGHALRMRPDRLVIGDCRGGEALDILQAMNGGLDGSLMSLHAHGPAEAVRRLETLVPLAGVDLSSRAIREQIASAIQLVVQQSLLADGSRRVTSVSEVAGIDATSGEIELRPIFEFAPTGTGPQGRVVGEFRTTGYLPSFLQTFLAMGLVKRGEPYL